jgi:hypothetical protein
MVLHMADDNSGSSRPLATPDSPPQHYQAKSTSALISKGWNRVEVQERYRAFLGISALQKTHLMEIGTIECSILGLFHEAEDNAGMPTTLPGAAFFRL